VKVLENVMNVPNKLAFACVTALSVLASLVTGCAADRPMRNGVPNEDLYLRKSFIIRPGQAKGPDEPSRDDGWLLKASVLSTSTPNPLAKSVLFTGAENGGMLVRFVATQDKLQLVNLREISRSPEVDQKARATPRCSPRGTPITAISSSPSPPMVRRPTGSR